MPFTKGQIAAYLEFPGVCPSCGDGDLEAGEAEDLGGTEFMIRQTCQTCGKNWREYFKLHDIEEEDAEGCAIPNEEPQEDRLARIIRILKETFETIEDEAKGLLDHWRTPTLTLLGAYRQGLDIYERGYLRAFQKGRRL